MAPRSKLLLLTRSIFAIIILILIAMVLARRKPGIAIALLLLLAMPHIKLRKLQQQLREAHERGHQREARDIEIAIQRWNLVALGYRGPVIDEEPKA
jgi:hypothetical protein